MESNHLQNNNRILNDYFRSGAVLVRGILQLLALGAGIGFCLAMNAQTPRIVSLINKEYGTNVPVNSVLTSAVPSIITTAIPMVLIAVAYFIIFGKSRSSKPNARSDAGFIILNIFAIIELVCVIIASVAVVAGSVFIFLRKPKDLSANSSRVLMASLIGTVVMCVIALIIAIIYKAYIGSVRKTAKTAELCNTGAKAFGVFSVLSAISSAFGVLGTLGLFILRSRVVDLLRNAAITDIPEELSSIFVDGSMWLFLCLFLSALITFITHIVDAKIALGYNRHIKEARLNGSAGDVNDPPMNDGFYGGDDQPRKRKRSGYGDRFIED